MAARFSEILMIPGVQTTLEVFVVLLGAVVGSFLNVCIYRIPRDQSLVRPRSSCPHCGKMIAWFDNVPLISFLALRGRCRHCGDSISMRYPFVEALTAFLFWWSLRTFGWDSSAFVAILLSCAMVVVSFIDLDFQIIPNRITYPGIPLGLLCSFLWPSIHALDRDASSWMGLKAGVMGSLAGYGLLAAVGLVAFVIYRKEAMGRGDFKLLALLGTIVGWKGVLWTLFLACLVGSVVGITLILLGRRDRKDYIPFGPFLASAGLGVFFFRPFFDEVWSLYAQGISPVNL